MSKKTEQDSVDKHKSITSPTYCEWYPNELATVELTYGLYSEYQKGRRHNVHKLCIKASKELFEKCAPLINSGYMHWVNKPLNV
jgi:hypothetical protein